MASATTLSSIVAPSSSSLSLLPSDHSFTHFSPKPTKPLLFKTLTLKPHNFTISPLPLLFPLHLCLSSASAFNDTESAISDESEQNPNDDFGQEQDGEVTEVDEAEEEIGSNDNKVSESTDDCKLYVGNLAYSMTSSELAEIFAEAGQVRSVEIIYDKMTDRSRGFGFVMMGSVDEAKEAIRMFDGSQVGGRTVRVNFPEVPRGGEPKVMAPKIRRSNASFVDTPNKIYAGNLGWGVTSQGLSDAFADQEGFVSAKVIYERESGRSRGFGFISFSSAEAAQSAIASLNGVELEGRPLRLNMAAERAHPSPEAGAEQSEELSAVNY